MENNKNLDSKIKLEFAQEYLRQIRLSFNLALAATAISFGFSLFGGILLISGKLSWICVICFSNLISCAKCWQFAKKIRLKFPKS